MRLLFDHIEKCGGMTINHYLRSCYEENNSVFLYQEGVCKAVNAAFWKPIPDLVCGHHAIYLSHLCPDHLKATVLREPVARVVSLFKFCKQRKYIPVTMTVREFTQKPIARNYYAWRFSGVPPFMIHNCPELAVDRAVSVLSSYDRVGFTDDIQGFIHSLGLGKPYIPMVRNKTQYQEEITESDMDLIRSVTELDSQVYLAMRQQAHKNTLLASFV
jgi:hypothetical protein